MVIRMLSFVARVEFNWISALCTCCIEIVPVQRLSTQPRHCFAPSCELQNALCYMFVKTVLQVVEVKHCHTEVSLAENGPPE